MSVNKVILVGRLGQDAEVRQGTTDFIVANVSLATSHTWKDKNTGERREETEWHRVVFYNRQAEIVRDYTSKGKMIYVEGRLKTRKWQDNGVDRYTTEVIADVIQLLGGREDGSNTNNSNGNNSSNSNKNNNRGYSTPLQQQQPQQQQQYNDDDIPW